MLFFNFHIEHIAAERFAFNPTQWNKMKVFRFYNLAFNLISILVPHY